MSGLANREKTKGSRVKGELQGDRRAGRVVGAGGQPRGEPVGHTVGGVHVGFLQRGFVAQTDGEPRVDHGAECVDGDRLRCPLPAPVGGRACRVSRNLSIRGNIQMRGAVENSAVAVTHAHGEAALGVREGIHAKLVGHQRDGAQRRSREQIGIGADRGKSRAVGRRDPSAAGRRGAGRRGGQGRSSQSPRIGRTPETRATWRRGRRRNGRRAEFSWVSGGVSSYSAG